MPSQNGIECVVGTIPGVVSVEVDTVKPGVIRVRVVGGALESVRKVMSAVKSVGCGVAIEHRSDPDAAMTEIFL